MYVIVDIEWIKSKNGTDVELKIMFEVYKRFYASEVLNKSLRQMLMNKIMATWNVFKSNLHEEKLYW